MIASPPNFDLPASDLEPSLEPSLAEPMSAGSDASQQTKERLAQARRRFEDFKPKVPDSSMERELSHGWLLPTLLFLDEGLWKRWDYWRECRETEELPVARIPRLDILDFPHAGTRKMLEASLDCIPQHGSWQTWGGWQYFDYLLSWLLFGLGHKGQKELPSEPTGCVGASNRLCQVFALDAMVLWPHDYFGDILAESSYGKRQGFYPTPHTVCEFMTQMMMPEDRDCRSESVCDPCVGTGRMLLHASNRSLRLYGLDIDETLCKATLVNGYLYAPWMVRPLPQLDRELALLEEFAPQGGTCEIELAEGLSDAMLRHAEPESRSVLFPTEHDARGQKRVAPLLKRRRRDAFNPEQGSLF